MGIAPAASRACGTLSQGQFWKLQLAGGQRAMRRSDLTSHGSPCPQFPMPVTVDRLVPLMLWALSTMEPD